MSSSLASIATPGLPPASALLVMLLAAYVALDMGNRLTRLGLREQAPWLLAAAVALSCGLWATPVLGIAHLVGEVELGLDPGLAGAALLLPVALCLAGLNGVYVTGGPRRAWLTGAVLLGSAALGAQVLTLSALGVSPSVHWQPGWLLLAWLVASAGFAWALTVMQSGADDTGARKRQLAAALLIVIAIQLTQSLTLQAASLHTLSIRQSENFVPLGTVVTLASIACAELLLLMLLACAVESRVRGRLEEARAELQNHALRDELTGLPNRVAFETTLSQAQQQADATQGQAVLMLLAMDGFKQINEGLGHQAGDRVLQRVAARLRDMLPEPTVARLNGDEFLLLLSGDQALAQASALAARVLESIAQPFRLDGRDVALSASIGLAVYPQHGSMSALITHASVAARAAKAAGGATYSVFDARMVVDSREQADLLRDLRLALRRAQLELYYQPKIHAPTAQITGVEALLRWHHPQRGTISPSIFIPMAERCGLINALGDWVIDEACRQVRAWREQGIRMRVAINLSAHQLRQPDLPKRISAALTRHRINPDLLTCEITESVAMEDTDATMRFFTDLAAIGVHISIDDFGSGYSSLAYLRKLPAGELKIDRSFVLDLATSDEARKIAAAVVQLAQALSLKVVAEGVETEEQFQILRSLGCDELQGFLFAKPMSAKALQLWATNDEGPRSVQFSEALFKETQAMAL